MTEGNDYPDTFPPFLQDATCTLQKGWIFLCNLLGQQLWGQGWHGTVLCADIS